MQFTAAQIALLINAKIEGDPGAIVSSFGKIEEAKQASWPFSPIPNTKIIYTPQALSYHHSMKLRN